MSSSVESLFNMAMNFIVKNIVLVESLNGFPSLVGEDMFKRFILEGEIEKSVSLLGVFKKFVNAYQDMVLQKLNLSEKLIILNEHFEVIIVLSLYITELCVCGCFLGENHELYSHLSDFECLRKLCLRDNSMTDSTMQKLTLRTRMYGLGNKNLESLDLSGNNFTDGIIPYLTAFPKLQWLNLSGSKLTKKALQTLATKYSLYQIFCKNEHEKVTTEGWAAVLINKWIEYDISKRRKKEKEKENKFYLKKHITQVQKPSCSQTQPSQTLMFQKNQLKNEVQYPVPAKRQKFSAACDKKGIEEDIFSLYK